MAVGLGRRETSISSFPLILQGTNFYFVSIPKHLTTDLSIRDPKTVFPRGPLSPQNDLNPIMFTKKFWSIFTSTFIFQWICSTLNFLLNLTT